LPDSPEIGQGENYLCVAIDRVSRSYGKKGEGQAIIRREDLIVGEIGAVLGIREVIGESELCPRPVFMLPNSILTVMGLAMKLSIFEIA